MSFLTDALSLEHVPRWSTVRHYRGQSVAEHSYNVAIIANEICERLELSSPDVRRHNIILHALTHDLDECVTGDIPGIAKQHYKFQHEPMIDASKFVGVTLAETRIVKMADVIEAYTWLNTHGVGEHARKVVKWLSDDCLLPYARQHFTDEHNGLIMSMISEIVAEEGRLRT